MAKRTKKIGTAGRFGARYGVRVRRRVNEIEVIQNKKHECPVCHHESVKRVGSGIWMCRSCDAKFAASAYTPVPRRLISRVEE